jgi:hypothetical protein
MDVPAKDVIAQAQANGMKLSVAQVYNIRSTDKLKKTAGTSPRASVLRSVGVSSGDAEARLRRLIADVGLTRSKEILNEVLAAFGV